MEYGRRRSVLGRVRFVGTAHGAHRLSWNVCEIEATALGREGSAAEGESFSSPIMTSRLEGNSSTTS